MAAPVSDVRRSQIIAALSIATDLAIGQPVELALKSCVLGVRLAEGAGLGAEEIVEVYYQALLRYIGCNAETYSFAALFGDEIEFRRDVAPIDLASPPELVPVLVRAVRRANAGAALPSLILAIAKGLKRGPGTSAAMLSGHCEVAQRLAERLGFGPGVVRNLGQLYERWDGRGLPHGLKGEAVAPAVRVVRLAQDMIVLADAHGIDGAIAIVRKRRGRMYDPRLVDYLLPRATWLMAELAQQNSWDAVLAFDRDPGAVLTEDELDAACLAMADFIDIKSPFTLGHSRAVSALAESAARGCGRPEGDVIAVRRAALVHDIGKAGPRS